MNRLSRARSSTLPPGTLLVPRGDGTLQIGYGAESVAVSDPDGRLHRSLSEPGSGDGDDPCESLRRAGLLAAPPPRAAPAPVQVVGTSTLARALTTLLDTEPGLELVDPEVASRTGTGLTVVVSDTLEPDRLLSERLLRRGLAHLLVRPLPRGAVVGPLVVPGRTGCLHCADLLRSDADPAWPAVLQASTRTAVPPDGVAGAWAAAYAAGQVLAYASEGTAETLGSTVELVAPDYRLRWRAWPAHPDCGCWW